MNSNGPDQQWRSEIVFFVHNFNMTLKTSVTFEKAAKVQYLCTLVHGEAFCWFDTLSADVEIKTPLTVEAITSGLGSYLFPANSLLKKKRKMCRGTRKPRKLKVRRYATHLVDLNKYLVLFPGAKLTDNFL